MYRPLVKLGLYTPLLLPSQPWESVSMDFVGGFPMSRSSHDYLYVVVDRFSKICILIPCKKQVTIEQTTQLFFSHVWVHFGLPTSIVSNWDSRLLGNFGLVYGTHYATWQKIYTNNENSIPKNPFLCVKNTKINLQIEKWCYQ